MEGILSFHSIVRKKEKNKALAKEPLSIIQSSSKYLDNINSHSSKNLLIKNKLIININENIDVKSRKKLTSQRKSTHNISLYKKYNFEKKFEPLIHSDNIKSEFKSEKGSNTPLMNLQKIKKPNYMMKSVFIKDKAFTPQENNFQNTSCPIYDFYKGNSEFNSNKTSNILPNDSFSKYYNNFKRVNKAMPNSLLDINPSPLTNLTNKNSINYYQKDLFEKNKKYEKLSSLDEQDNTNCTNNLERDENFNDFKNEIQSFEGNTPLYIEGTFSPSYDFFEENIFLNNENTNYLKSPINYKQMNVNININNHSQNNNIYYHIPNIINSNSNSFNNNSNNNESINHILLDKYDPINDNTNQNNWQINTLNNIRNLQNNLNNNQINLDTNLHFNKELNIINNLQNQTINLNNQNDIKNFFSPYNQKIDLNNISFKLNVLQNLNINKNNYYLNQNSNINDIRQINNLNKNNINNNLNYISKNNINNQNINFSSLANEYINENNQNQNILNSNQHLNQLKYQRIMNNSNNNRINEQIFQQNINNQEKTFQNNSNNAIISNNQIFENYSNNCNQTNNNRIINNKKNLPQININSMPESFFYTLTPIQLANQCHIITKNQNGCRYLQNYISLNTDLLKNLFFPKILEHIKELSNDQFANYFIKKMFNYLTEEMILLLIQSLIPMIDQIGTNQYGTRVLQDLIDFLDTDKTFLAFVNLIIPHVKLLIIDLNGSHIIYKLILTKNKNVKIIEDIICMQVKEIAITRKGCSFLKKYFDFKDENELIKIKKKILQNLTEIITDQYGNYVIQSILTKEGSQIAKEYIKEINKNIVFYSNNKFSSNAVEKCFENEEMKNLVLDQFLQKNIFEKIILDKFGNYVVQKAIAKADINSKNYMLQLLLPLVPKLKTHYFGQRLLSKLVSQYPNLSNII